MKNKKNNKRKTRDFSFSRFFHPTESRTKSWYYSGPGHVAWNSMVKGTYVRAIHGELK